MTDKSYCIFLDKNHKHDGFVCQLGLNVRYVDNSTFVSRNYDTNITGGFRIFDYDYISENNYLISHEQYICNITLPIDDPDFIKVIGHHNSEFVNKIIIDGIYDIGDDETIDYYNLYGYVVQWTAINGDLKSLQYWLNSDIEFPIQVICSYDPFEYLIDDITDIASCYGHIHILNWLKNESGFPFKCSSSAIKNASENGQIKTLQWWKDTGLKLKYCRRAIDYATANGMITSLNWWLNSGLNMSYSSKGIEMAALYGKIESIKWWLESGKPIYYNEWAIINASEKGHLDIIKLLYNSNCDFIYTKEAIETAQKYNQQSVVEWFEKSGLDLNHVYEYHDNPDLKFYGYDYIDRRY